MNFSPFMDESTELADLILPDHTYLESYQAYEVASLVGQPVVGVAQPVVKPLYDTANLADVLLWMARQMGVR